MLRPFNGFCRFLLAMLLLTPLGVAAEREERGRRQLSRLNPDQVPAELALHPPRAEVVAAFYVGQRPIVSLGFLGDGEQLVVAEAGPPRRNQAPAGRVLLYDLTGKSPEKVGVLAATEDQVEAMAVSPLSGKFLATGSIRWDQQLKLWHQDDRGVSLVTTIPDFADWWIKALTFSPDEHMLASVSGDKGGPVRLWHVDKHQLRKQTVLPGPSWSVSALAFSPDGRFLAAGLGSEHRAPQDGQLLIWEIADPPKPVYQAAASAIHAKSDVSALVWSDDGRQLVTGDQEGSIQFHRVLDDGKLEPLAEVTAHAHGVRSLVAIADDRFVSSGYDGFVTVWSADQKRGRQWKLGAQGVVLAVAPSRTHVAAGLTNGTVYVLQIPAD
jgi:WD40 repeat protein